MSTATCLHLANQSAMRVTDNELMVASVWLGVVPAQRYPLQGIINRLCAGERITPDDEVSMELRSFKGNVHHDLHSQASH